MSQQIDDWVEGGFSADLARRWVRAVWLGGCTTAEALGLIRDKDVPKDAMAVDLSEPGWVPQDRWFRAAWGRSANGGPIVVRMTIAREIQADKITRAVLYMREIWQRESMKTTLLGGSFRAPDVNLDGLGELIQASCVPGELKSIWPEGLPQ